MFTKLTRYLTTLLCLLAFPLTGQTDLPVVLTTENVLSIKENGVLEDTWSLAPEAKPDVYTSNAIGTTITFVTDKDSISHTLTKTSSFDFIVLYGKDSCYTRIAYEPSKLDVLKSAAKYEARPNEVKIPAFTYQSADSPPLRELRKKYKLDSIAGQGDDVSQMLNLMRWVHNAIEHNGNKPNEGKMNADQFLTSCRKGGGTLNCRGLAITLNEVYLAMGIPSRFVTCIPKDTSDFDCHVINTAFSSKLNKWIWLDPTQNAYVMDEKGELLSIPEVRERLINDQPLLLNPDANWNYRGTTDKAWYLGYYMAKNLYQFSTPLHSSYNYESDEKGKEMIIYVDLWPAKAGLYLPAYAKKTNKGGTTYVNYRSGNPDLFWSAPTVVK